MSLLYRSVVKSLIVCICLLLIFIEQNLAQKAPGQLSDSSSLAPVTVIAQRKQELETKVPAAISILTATDFRRQGSRTLPEFLSNAPGVFIQKTNHGGGSAFIRGLTGNQVLTLVDGIRVNNSTFRYGPNQYLNTIDAYSVQRVEIARGTGSVQYGSDAIGGVTDVTTKEPGYSNNKGPARWQQSNVSFRHMSQNMDNTGHGEVFYGGEKVAAYFGGTLRNFGELYGGKRTGKQSPSGYDEWSVNGKVRIKLHKESELIAASQFLRQSDVPVYHKVQLENFIVNQFPVQQRSLQYVKFKLKNRQPLISEVEITASLQNTIEERESRKNGNPVSVFERDKVQTIGLTASVLSRFSNRWNAVSGVESYADRVRSNKLDINNENDQVIVKRGLYPDNATFDNLSVYSLHYFDMGRFHFNGGLRYNAFAIKIPDTTLGKVKTNPDALVFNGGVSYEVSEYSNVYVSVGSGYRAPNIDDMGTLGIVDFRYEIPSYNLLPEKSINFEGGYKVWRKNINYNISAYYLKLNNIITRERSGTDSINGYQVYSKQNTQEAFLTGFESNMSVDIIRHLRASASVTYAYGKSISNKEPLRRVPPLFGQLALSYSARAWFASVDMQYAAKQSRLAQGDIDDNRIADDGTPGWTTVNLNGGYTYKSISLNVGLMNVFDTDYRTHGSGINGYGRSLWLELRYQL